MTYATIGDVQKVLGSDSTTYPTELTVQHEFAEGIIDGALAGIYDLRFDDVAKYLEVPVQITLISSYLVAYKIWDKATVLEGQVSDTAADGWKSEAMSMLDKIRNGDMRLTLPDGTLVGAPTSSIPRSYPEGERDKAPSTDNDPYFTRAQAGKW